MPKIEIINSIYADNGPDLKAAYPVNLVPIAIESGVNSGYLRPGDGIEFSGNGSGNDRGGIEWNGIMFRAMGTKLVRIDQDNSLTVLGDIGGSTPVSFDYSFDRLAIASNGNLYYYSPSLGLIRVTDPDLGKVIDVCWVDGYFMTTDGTSLVVTELNDPTSVNPLKYGSSEIDPDPIVAVIKVRNEIHAVNTHSIEVFENVGGDLFPFQRLRGAQITRGAVGTHAVCRFADTLAFVGSGRGEAPAIYLGSNSQIEKISNASIDGLLASYSSIELSEIVVESRVHNNLQSLYVHLPDRTVVFDLTSSKLFQTQVWYVLTSSIIGFSKYQARYFIWCYDSWYCGDPTSSRFGKLVTTSSNQWGNTVRWEFGTLMLYNESHGAIFHQLELVSLNGSVEQGATPRISTSYSVDGSTWSQDKTITVGLIGDRTKRLVWLRNGFMRNWRIQRFTGTSDSHISFVRLESQLEPLA